MEGWGQAQRAAAHSVHVGAQVWPPALHGSPNTDGCDSQTLLGKTANIKLTSTRRGSGLTQGSRAKGSGNTHDRLFRTSLWLSWPSPRAHGKELGGCKGSYAVSRDAASASRMVTLTSAFSSNSKFVVHSLQTSCHICASKPPPGQPHSLTELKAAPEYNNETQEQNMSVLP